MEAAVFGLLGPNGAGKTSLLRMLATVIPPSSGRLRLLGRDPGSYQQRRQIRRRWDTCRRTSAITPGSRSPSSSSTSRCSRRCRRNASRLPSRQRWSAPGSGDKARAKLRTLSGGMLRRAGIAQAIVNEPELLLLDEPTAGLDPQQRVTFRALLRDLGQRATVVVSTHLVEDVGAVCSQFALMDQGKIVFCGTRPS